jgi:cold shock CspA family protein
MSTGVVKFYAEPTESSSGWGIITPHGVKRGDRTREVFFHENDVDETSPAPNRGSKGQECEFSLVPGYIPPEGQGPMALTVKLLGRRAYVPITDGHKRKAMTAHGD